MFIRRVSSQTLSGFYAREVARREWHFYGTLGFHNRRISYDEADHCFWVWLCDPRRKSDITINDIPHFRVNTSRAFPDRPVFYVLIGPLEDRTAYRLVDRWIEIAGDADLSCFYPRGDACEFIENISRIDTEFAVDYVLFS